MDIRDAIVKRALYMLLLGGLLSACAQAQDDETPGEALFARCAKCHGLLGEGNRSIGAPKLAGRETWYLTRQLENFRSGARGTDVHDELGAQMTPMAASLAGAQDVADLTAFIATLPDTLAPRTVRGDVIAGRELYRVCASCHGDRAQGNRNLSAPRLSRMNDWYLVNQLNGYRIGARGAHQDDRFGQQMVPIADVLVSERSVRDLVAYISELD